MIYSKSAEYAIQAMIYLAEQDGDRLSMVSEIAEDHNIPRHFLAKLVQTLTRHHLIKSFRGRKGGIRLARSADKITLLQVVHAIEGPPPENEMCVIGLDICSDDACCPLHSKWKYIKEEVRATLHHQTLKELAIGMQQKREQLALLASGGDGKK
ncbi:MAG: Rrf2 family transcriptional regulator [Candidatus Marinimicrobia bacterium]|nr:Rrf2 family transcriptional regulator [Candidatus Neomarinimicrobiota bacterium]